MGSALAGDGQVEVGVEKLLGEEDDLAGVEFEVADDAVDGFEHRGRARRVESFSVESSLSSASSRPSGVSRGAYDLAGAGVRATASSGPHISESRHGAPEVGKPGCYHGLTAGVRRTVALVRGRVGAAAPRNSCTELAAGLVSQRLPEGSMEMAPGTEAV